MAHGGKRPGAGRKPGRKDKASTEQLERIAELARSHTGTAINTLVTICRNGESEAAQVSAANSLLDRGYGKPKQTVDGDVKGDLTVTLYMDGDGKKHRSSE